MRRLCYIVPLVALLGGGAGTALAQQPASEQQTPPPTQVGDYSVTGVAEVGQRFLSLNGSDAKYQSDLNYEPGVRLFDFDTTIRTAPDAGKAFDTLRINAFGWGGDPSEVLQATAEKHEWYEADVNVRRWSYYNDLQNLALNEHMANTTRNNTDVNVTLFPASTRFRATFGYTAERDSGTMLWTYEYDRDLFQTTSPLQTSANDYRANIDTTLSGVQFTLLQGYRQFSDNTTYLIPSFQAGQGTAPTTLSMLTRTVPTTGHLPFTRASAHRAFGSRVDVTARFIYTDGSTRANLTETVTGTNASNQTILSDMTGIAGNANRPNRLGDVGVSWSVNDRLSINDTFRVNDFTIDGAAALNETTLVASPAGVLLPPSVTSSTSAATIDYSQVLDTLEADYEFSPQFTVHAGDRYGSRQITQVTPGLPNDVTNNDTNMVLAGFQARPVSMWRLYADVEHGTADNVFTRISNYDVTNVRFRNVIKPRRTVTINASLVTRNNNNPALTLGTPPQDFGVTVKTRIITSTVDWSPTRAFSLSGGYTYSDVNSNAAILFYLNNLLEQGTSLYFMHDHAPFVNATVRVHPRLLLILGYRLDKDTGQGNFVATSPTQLVSAYPLQRNAPEARVTATLFRNLDWITSWQLQDYAEQLFPIQDYRAQVIYTSLRFRLIGR